ncbi:DUF1801 domain-containing protein [Rhodococcus sp. NPDC057014]|uniref:DUF1801 domain-containing protein n=1 Tax=Rhodococcus sp. NPDC057014 TaxID=3346000 RepID=UPI00362F5553
MAKRTSGSDGGRGDSPSQLIDARIEELGDWRGELLARIRALVTQADPDVVEEWKWRGVLEGNTRRAIDFHEGDTVDEKAFQAFVHAAVALNTSRRA